MVLRDYSLFIGDSFIQRLQFFWCKREFTYFSITLPKKERFFIEVR